MQQIVVGKVTKISNYTLIKLKYRYLNRGSLHKTCGRACAKDAEMSQRHNSYPNIYSLRISQITIECIYAKLCVSISSAIDEMQASVEVR